MKKQGEVRKVFEIPKNGEITVCSKCRQRLVVCLIGPLIQMGQLQRAIPPQYHPPTHLYVLSVKSGHLFRLSGLLIQTGQLQQGDTSLNITHPPTCMY